jgi:DNA-directed RNA polymerase subunit RPC12/RpoP
MNINEFKKKAFNIYKDIQTAWMNFDTKTIRKLTTDEIYNMYSSQLETLKLKGQKNIMTDITLDEVKIIDIKEQNNIITTSVYLRVKCYDYVIKEATNEVVRGKDKEKIVIEYVLSFVKSAINNNKEEKCPNCGAKVEINSSSTCPYCDSVLVKDASDYVMSKKTCVGQYLDR